MGATDIFLIVVIVVALLILSVVGVYFIVHFQHPDDKNEARVPKAVVLGGFILAGACVLALPLDVANNAGYAGCGGWDTKFCGGLNMILFWNIIFILIMVWLVLLIPFSTFFYEADDGMLMAGTNVGGTPKSRVWQALKMQIFVILIVGTMFTIFYFLFRQTEIPVREYTAPRLTTLQDFVYVPKLDENGTVAEAFRLNMFEALTPADVTSAAETHRNPNLATITLQVSVPTFFTAMLAFVGWFFFALFGGVGLAYIPLDLILIYRHRPQHMNPAEFAESKESLMNRVNELVDIGELIKIEREQDTMGTPRRRCFGGFNRAEMKRRKEERQVLLEFRQAVMMLEQDNEDFQNCTANYEKYNPLIPYAALLGGGVSFILSFFWLLQIVLYVLPKKPIIPLLNTYFAWFDSWFPLFGVLSVAIFSSYLLLCAIKGCFKVGLRILFFTLHPMAPGKTYMSSFLFNIGLILLCSVPVVQFSVEAFAEYAKYTNIYQVMGTQIQYMTFFKYFFVNKVFVYALLSMMLLTTLYLIACRRKDASGDSIGLRDRLKARND